MRKLNALSNLETEHWNSTMQ